ncbi:uncharacterized protein LOC113507087 [Trichoplusia ni]|uniref:Uncharacterized protein LOC113507087 n=2 Tax=Trichoplusia ni TaxID=7111 RepID=A0A7E5WZX5_TRINI|nr:uncharacterized protein LOC113507087 [Trichoplusia ni]
MTSQSASQLKGLLDTTTECLNNFNNLNIDTGSWDPFLIYLLVQKMDSETHKNWEEHAYKEESENLPTWSDFKKFLESKYRTLELTNQNSTSRDTKIIKERSCHVASPVTEKVCVMCKENHSLSHCKEFCKKEPTERREFVKTKQLCFNCLVPGHSAFKCKVPVSCRLCHRRHHSLLHETKIKQQGESSVTLPPTVTHVEEKQALQVNTMIASHYNTKKRIAALLATAEVEATSEQGNTIVLRALIDQGSEAAFISEKATQLLKLERQPVKASIIGVGSQRTEIKHVVQLRIRSRSDRNYCLPIKAYVMSKQLTTKIPTKTINKQDWTHIQDLNLADPNYFKPGSIDMLLGVKEYAEILQNNLIKGPPGTPSAQETSLGWILFGEVNTTHQSQYVVMHHSVDVEDMLKSIWEIDVDTKRHLTKDEKLCEEIYESTTARNEEGRYIVKLPFNTYSPQSPDGNTKSIAAHRFTLLEKKFRKSPDLQKEYSKVINDYIKQGHIEKVPDIENDKRAVYLPHHAVTRADKESTRTRVVFDASCKGSNNVSLNDELLVGPQLQEDLRNILMRWRMKRVCFMADIKQMFRQVLVSPEDADFQRILWRQQESDTLEEYRLLRVTFGTASAPYLAVKTLQQVAKDEAKNNILVAQTINEDFYMDDLLSGTDSVSEALSLSKELSVTLQKGGFQLTKWASNSIVLMKYIEEDKRSARAHIDLNLDGTLKALGIEWNLKTDQFRYNLRFTPITKSITKRNILSDIQKVFDPLGWIAPSTVMAKILIQKIWLERVNWDEQVSNTLEQEWREIRSDFVNITEIKIERWLGTMTVNNDKTQIHGFSDASMRAYAAAVYVRIHTLDNKIETKLIAARTRVAPLKTISLPRLELCGALLLSKLMKQVGQSMRIPTSRMYAWTDSSIVIAWLSGEPNRWKPFVANRVVEIVENINNKHWFHVQSHENPADLASRGLLLSDLKKSNLWWHGPGWLSETKINIKHEMAETDLEMKKIKINTYLNAERSEEPETTLISQFDNFETLTDLIKVITYCRRFINYKKNINSENQNLTTQELEVTLQICIKKTQEEEFKEEIERIKLGKQVKKRSQLRCLNPYLDEKNVLRVGGRLRHANLPNDKKNPVILGNRNTLVQLIIADAHDKTLHGGVQLMICHLRSKYWIIRVKSLVKRHIHKCMKCARMNATTKVQIMGDLPLERVTPTRPFLHSGVDFAGPLQTLVSKGRGNKTRKTYVAIFICMSTKAIHLELVGDLTSEAFIGAFRRFVARRGKCSHLWCDNGKNFVGANRELHDLWNEAQMTGEVTSTLATDGTQFHFIPAYSPNFGGLWEAGVKSIKYHLKRIITTHLTFEEMTTILCQIEACLNSRPLCPIDTNDPENLDPLTPGHFLIGEPPIVVPSPDLQAVKVNNLSRWQHTQKILHDFWRRWQEEYLTRLQQRPKWMKKEKEFAIGDIVLIKTENLPPSKWSLGRIIDKHPGTDGNTRVYSVKSGDSITKRTITKLCAMPVDST